MNANLESDNRLLDASETEMVSITRSPEIEQQSLEQLKALTHRLRQAHGRAKDISARQQREIRGKGDPRGIKRVQCYLRRFSASTESFRVAKKSKWRHPARPNSLAALLSSR